MNISQPSPSRLVILGLLLLALLWTAGQGFSPAADSKPNPDLAESIQEACSLDAGDAKGIARLREDPHARKFAGLHTCARCHLKGVEGEFKYGGVVISLDKEQWVTYREMQILADKDKHAQAYAVLLNERSKNMGKILKTKVHLDKRCLACHTGFPVEQMEADKKDTTGVLISETAFKNMEVTLGVTCEGCHGPSEVVSGKGLQGWFRAHQDSDPWRFLAPKYKETNHGFWDVRSPASKTKMCASCHIGSVEQGRVVTHEMYAAGHPPLPGFEVETFIKQMPEHWNLLSKKSPEVIERFIKNTKDPIYANGAYKKENLNQTRALLVGALVTTSEYFHLIGDLSDTKPVGPIKDLDWPELAVFDCYACHHELKSVAWRQVRKPPAGIPGRPFLQEWNSALVNIALGQLGDAPQKYRPKFEAIRQALNKQPFGSRAELKRSTKEAAAWLYARAEELQLKQLPPELGPEVMREIAKKGSSEIHDYESARQFVWGLEIVDAEVKRIGAKKIEGTLQPKGKEMFLLDLRAGRKAQTSIPGEKQVRPIVEVDLGTVMPFIADYDPRRFQQRFFEIGKMLK